MDHTLISEVLGECTGFEVPVQEEKCQDVVFSQFIS